MNFQRSEEKIFPLIKVQAQSGPTPFRVKHQMLFLKKTLLCEKWFREDDHIIFETKKMLNPLGIFLETEMKTFILCLRVK